MTMVVRFWQRCSIASCTCFSDSGIERRGRLVEQNDRRIPQQRARHRDALTLAAGQLRAVLADRRVVAERKAHDEIVRAGRLRRGDDLGLAGAHACRTRCWPRWCRGTDTHPVRHRRSAGEAICATPLAIDCPSIRISPLVSLIEPQQQRQHRRLAAAGGADQRRDLSGLGDKTHAVEHRLVRPVGETHLAQFDPRVGQFQRRLVVVVGLAGRTVDDLEQFAGADQAGVQFDIQPRQTLGRLIGQTGTRSGTRRTGRASRPARRRCSRHTSARLRPRSRRAFPSAGSSGWKPAPSCWR